MTHYKPYPEYKDSGIDWIGRIPKHWNLTKLRYLGMCQNGINIGGDYFGSGYPFVSYGDVYNNRVLPSMVDGLLESSENDRNIYSVEHGDVLFTRTSETIEEIGISSVCKKSIENSVFAGFLIRFRPFQTRLSTDYSEYYFQNEKLRAFFTKEMNIVTRASLSQELLKKMPVLIPPEGEQDHISKYLCSKVGAIESLVSKKYKFLELIKEKILAVVMNEQINGAGELERLKRMTQVISRPATIVDNDEYIALGLYNRGRGLFHKPITLGKDMGDSTFFYVEEGDLILSGQFAWEGAVTMASENENGCVVSHRYPVIRGTSVATEYLLALFMSDFGDFLLNESSRGAAGRNRPLNINLLLNEKIRIPSINVQNEIRRLMYLRSQAEVKVKKSIELLKERRSAFITAAVTGQIDLREESK